MQIGSSGSRKLAPGVWRIPLMSPEAAASFVQAFESESDWLPACVGDELGEVSVKVAIRCCATLAPICAKPLASSLNGILRSAISSFCPSMGCYDLLMPSIIRYNRGDFYSNHIDTDPVNLRRHSVIMYLNDNFEGGETIFPNKGIVVAPMAGHCILFPPGEVHRGDPVLSGTKYIAATWALSKAREPLRIQFETSGIF